MNRLYDEAWRKDPERIVIFNNHKPDDELKRCLRCGASVDELKEAWPTGIVCMGRQGDE